jgi:hypothetical protein
MANKQALLAVCTDGSERVRRERRSVQQLRQGCRLWPAARLCRPIDHHRGSRRQGASTDRHDEPSRRRQSDLRARCPASAAGSADRSATSSGCEADADRRSRLLNDKARVSLLPGCAKRCSKSQFAPYWLNRWPKLRDRRAALPPSRDENAKQKRDCKRRQRRFADKLAQDVQRHVRLSANIDGIADPEACRTDCLGCPVNRRFPVPSRLEGIRCGKLVTHAGLLDLRRIRSGWSLVWDLWSSRTRQTYRDRCDEKLVRDLYPRVALHPSLCRYLDGNWPSGSPSKSDDPSGIGLGHREGRRHRRPSAAPYGRASKGIVPTPSTRKHAFPSPLRQPTTELSIPSDRNAGGPTPVGRRTRRVTTGHNGDDGRGAILPVSARGTNASVRACI